VGRIELRFLKKRVDSFYYLSYLNSAGYFKALSRGMSALQNIIVSDVKNIPISFKD
jgi:restriction endonuclease S subunit